MFRFSGQNEWRSSKNQGIGEKRGCKRRSDILNLQPSKRSRCDDNNNCSSASAQLAMDVAELIERLAVVGFLSSPSTPVTQSPVTVPSEKREMISGKQCSNCNRWFDESQTTEYNDHLDWHFMQNRQRNTAKNFARRVQSETSENWWAMDKVVDKNEAVLGNNFLQKIINDIKKKTEKPMKQPSLKDTGVQRCFLCHENFEEFFDQEQEEWRIKPAVRHNNRVVHPGCI